MFQGSSTVETSVGWEQIPVFTLHCHLAGTELYSLLTETGV